MVASPRWAKPSPREVRAQLARRPPFDRMADRDLEWLAERVELRTWPAGAVVLAHGHESPALYVIVEGEAQMEAMGAIPEEGRVLAELHAGECFPVEALEEQRPVFSTIRARTELACYQLVTAEFRELRRRSHRFREFTAHRASAFLEQSRRAFHSHFSQQGGQPPALSSPLSILMRPDPLTCPPETPLREALAALDAAGAESLVVIDPERRPLGVLDLRGVLRNVTLAALDLALPVERAMRSEPVQLAPGAFGFEAALLMAEKGARQILVVEDGRLVGAVDERALFGFERARMGQTSIQIRNAAGIEQLVPLSLDVRTMARNLLVQGVAADQLIRIISTLNDQLARRVVEVEAQAARFDDLPFAWIALGSEGRMEQTLSTDQDNGIIFDLPAAGADPESVRARLIPFAQRVNDSLAACGFPKCKGGVMAGNPRWCLSLEEWKAAFERWLFRPEPEALLNACIFFDLRHIHGAERLTRELTGWLSTSAQLHARFLAVFAEAALGRSPPLGLLRDFVLEESGPDRGTLDLKTDGITLFVDAARVLALRHGIAETNTTLRLRAVADRVGATGGDVTAWIDAFQFIELLRLRHQHERFDEARPMDNRIDPQALNPLDRRFLLESLRQAGRLQRRLAAHFGLPGAGL